MFMQQLALHDEKDGEHWGRAHVAVMGWRGGGGSWVCVCHITVTVTVTEVGSAIKQPTRSQTLMEDQEMTLVGAAHDVYAAAKSA
jgi:hypothetical protein